MNLIPLYNYYAKILTLTYIHVCHDICHHNMAIVQKMNDCLLNLAATLELLYRYSGFHYDFLGGDQLILQNAYVFRTVSFKHFHCKQNCIGQGKNVTLSSLYEFKS